jgi:hypothetical protein
MRLAVLAFVLAACGSSKPASVDPGPPKPLDPNAPLPDDCKVSEDCALVQACCGCNAGGKQIAIRADAVAAFDASREQRCGDQMCAQVISTDPSCSAEAVCGQNGRCIVAPHLQSQ